MPEKSMKEKLAAGDLVLCMNLRLARSVDIAMVAKAGGYDALYVDMQHAPYSIETTATICAAALGIGITPLVRVPNHDRQWMSRVLDAGAQGVILPDVNTRAQAEAIVAACRFPPLGKRPVAARKQPRMCMLRGSARRSTPVYEWHWGPTSVL